MSLFTDEEVTRYLPVRTEIQHLEIFLKTIDEYGQGPLGRWAIFDNATGQFAGMCLLRPFAYVPNQVEVGYVLNRAHWGKGIATEMVKALLTYGFAHTPTPEIVAVTDVRNSASQRVLLKAGFSQLEHLKRDNEELAYFKCVRP